MIEVRKKENESALSLIRRFSQRVKQSGNIIRVKSLRFKTRPKSNLKKKEDALRRVSRAANTTLLRKLGKIE